MNETNFFASNPIAWILTLVVVVLAVAIFFVKFIIIDNWDKLFGKFKKKKKSEGNEVLSENSNGTPLDTPPENNQTCLEQEVKDNSNGQNNDDTK